MNDSIALPGLTLHPDGSFVRQSIPTVPANPDFVDGVATKDFTIAKDKNLWVRVYLPQTGGQSKLLPVVVFYHGSGFLVASADYPDFDRFVRKLCQKLGIIFVSVNYRLAPEHRLPAAYEDGLAAIKWLECEASKIGADLSRVFVMGDSAGGNIAHHVSLQILKERNLNLNIAAQILIQPFFGGVSRTNSEFNPRGSISTEMCDILWKFALPEDSNRDHAYSNVPAKLRECAEFDLPRTLVIAGGEDVLHDREVEYVEVLRKLNKDVEFVVYENANHAFYGDLECEDTIKLLDKISVFVSES